MASVIESLAEWLASDGFVIGAESSTEASTSLQAGRMLDQPDLQACLFERNFAGGPHLTFRPDLVALEIMRLQVLVRGARGSYLSPRTVAHRARRRLTLLGDTTVGGIRILAAIPDGKVFDVGVDESDRQLFSANFIVTHEPES